MFTIDSAIEQVFWHNMAEVKQEIIAHRQAGMRLPKRVAGQMGNHVFMQIGALRSFLHGDSYAVRRSGVRGCTYQTLWGLIRYSKEGVTTAHIKTHRCDCSYCIGQQRGSRVDPLYARIGLLVTPWSSVAIEPIDPALVGTNHALRLDQWGLTVVLK